MTYACEKCEEVFTTKFALKIHLRTHKSPMTYTCEKCEEVFAKKSDLFKHSRLKHSDLKLKRIFKPSPPPPLNKNMRISSQSALNMFESITFTPIEEIWTRVHTEGVGVDP